ncbi:hypothetical protein AHF37_11279, partial [Paragonimus kellicotti]
LSKTTKEEIGRRIISSGGNVSVALPDVDFIVAPFFVNYLPKLSSACKLVTLYWVDRCVAECSILFDDLATEKAFNPIVRSGTPPLTGCVISLSGFIGKDRTLLTAYAQALGAIVQECFLRKPVPSRNLAASTHLIAAKPDGRKWPAAQLWGLPAVNRSWLYACAELWTKVEESRYPVQIQSETKDENSGTINQRGTPSTVSTSNRALLEIQLNNAHVQNEEYAERPLSTSAIDQQKVVPNSLADALRTPDWVCNNQPSTDLANTSRDSLGKIHKPSPPLSEQVARCLKKAVCRTAALPKRKLDLSDEDPEVLPLKDVVICVAKHLSARQVELNGVARQLGGDFKWIYDPQRLDALEVLNRYTVRSLKRTSFVFCRFEGECFERLRSMGASIYGPQIILHYVRENKPLPKTSYPLYSTALIGAVATVTSVTGPEREYLLSSIQALHGQASRDLFDGVNVVITPEVGSKKYLVGASRGLHILLPSWIKEAWKLSAIQDPIDMMLPTYIERFRVPIFSQLVICVSGLSAEERKEVSDLVLKHGGRYSGMMKVGETTHLIIKQAVGLKYSHAKKWKIQIVGVRWLIDSVNKGYAVNEEDYRVSEGKDHSSTPTCDANKVSLSFDNISVISHASSTTTRVDETRNDYLHAESVLLPTTNNTTPPILSNCLISLTDCTKDEVSLYSRLIEELGGQICAKLHDQVSEALTHVIVGSANPASKPTLEPDIVYVKGSWLVASRDAGRRVPESDHFFSEGDDSTLNVKSDADVSDFKPAMDTEDLKLINQYFGSGGLAEADDFTNGVSDVTKVDKRSRSLSVTSASVDLTTKPDTPSVGPGIFRGFTFFLHDDLSKTTKEEIGRRIISSGGNVSVALPDVDFIVAPFFVNYLPKLSSACKLVTLYWVDRCVAECSILFDDLATEKAFNPIVRSGTPPLTGCVISLSGFIGKDRTLLTAYAQALGAIVQECFLRKPVPSRNLAASTHLIAAKPDGRKWPAAQLWGLPAVNRSWLYACAELWTKVEESRYPVQIQSETKDENSGTINQRGTPSTVSTSNRALLEIQLNNAHVQNEEYAERPLSTSAIDQQKVVPNSLADALRTPDWVCNNQPSTDLANTSRDSLGKIHKPSPPLSEQVARCLKKAVCRTAALPKRKLDLS